MYKNLSQPIGTSLLHNLQLKETLTHIRQTEGHDTATMLEASISLPTRNNLTLQLKDILYVQAFGGGVYYVTPDKKFLVWHGFEQSQKMLPEAYFVKTH